MVRVISLVRKENHLLLLAYKGDYSYNEKKNLKNNKSRILIYR